MDASQKKCFLCLDGENKTLGANFVKIFSNNLLIEALEEVFEWKVSKLIIEKKKTVIIIFNFKTVSIGNG